MLSSVAAGIDGSREGLAAAHWAAQEAVRRGAGLVLVHARPDGPGPAPQSSPDVPGPAPHTPPHTPPDGGGRTARVLHEAAVSVRAAHPGLEVAAREETGAPVPVLLAAAGRADVLVLGSLGLGRAARGWGTGSVARQVAGRSPCPVVLVRAGRCAADEHLPAVDGVAPDEIPETPYRTVVLGLDVTHPCDDVLAFGFEAARRRGADLLAVHAVTVPPPGASAPGAEQGADPGTDVVAAREGALAAALRPWCEKYPAVAVTTAVVPGPAGAGLARAAAGAGLLVVGRRTGSGAPGSGAVVPEVVQHVAAPVAVVPHP
ncbi:universal stress protein [Streptomyces tropicalis]|uniref:Universal stress protein n=1 Tax=Streptomyces tropicalis TaxID=3034234 RepID=A0ABT6A3B7_9ACTN|nr:universal stress protein [Streptomyces tropicalis]MDF3299138.1 universal stress protein [Streptomyces tropicalis]